MELTEERRKGITRQVTKMMLLSQAKNFLSIHPEVVKHLSRKQRRKVANDLVKRLLKEAREDASV